jgi:hypothetical protein
MAKSWNFTFVIWLVLAGLSPFAIQAQTSGSKSKNPNKAEISNQTPGETQRGPVTVVEHQTISGNFGEKHEKPEQGQRSNAAHDWVDYINASSTAVIAIFTILLFIGVILQIRTSRNIERAWVLVDIGEAKPAKTALQVLRVAPIVTNHGSTIGRVLRTSITSRCIPNPPGKLPPEPDYAKPIEFDFVLAPSKSIRPMKVVFPGSEMQDAVGGKVALYVYGFIDYLDLGNEVRKTRFCFVYYVPPYEGDIGEPGFYIASEIPATYNECT